MQHGSLSKRAGIGERIPTFKEAIDLFKKSCGASTRLFVEIKTSPEEAEPDASARDAIR